MDAGVSKVANWGLDTAWYDENKVPQGGIFMGTNNVDVVRISFTTTANQKNWSENQPCGKSI